MEPDSRHPQRDAEHELLRHAAWIKRLALGLVGDATTAEDVVQDTWVAALRRPPPTGRALRPWLRTVVTNAARQGFRGGGRRAQRESEARAPGPLASPDELAERLETERRLTDELARLEEPFRSTLMLRYYEGLEPSEIARRLGAPAGTVRWRVSRGLELLRERMDRRFGKRAQWCALVMPLAGARELVPVAAAAVPGVLAMHAISKVALGVAGVVALAVTLGVTGLLPDSLWPLRPEAPAALAARPYVTSPEPERLDTSAAPAARVVVDGGQPASAPAADVPARSSARVEARVVDAAGSPFAGATLRAVSTSESAASGRDGHVQLELETSDQPASATFELSARGYASLGIEAVVTPGERVHLGVLELLPGGAVSGRVLDGLGQPLQGVRICAGEVETPRRVLEALRLHPDPWPVPATGTRADGSFMLEGLRDGQVRIWAVADGYLASYSAPVQVRAGEERYGLELRLDPIPPENNIAVAVVDPDGAPVAHARLDFRHESKSTGTSVSGDRETDAAGRHVFIVPADALLWVTAEDPELRHGPASASAVRTGSAPVVLRLRTVGRFDLAVRGEDGEPVEHFGFALLSSDGQLRVSILCARTARTRPRRRAPALRRLHGRDRRCGSRARASRSFRSERTASGQQGRRRALAPRGRSRSGQCPRPARRGRARARARAGETGSGLRERRLLRFAVAQ